MRGVSLLLMMAQALLAQDAPTPVVLWHGMGDSAAGMVGIAVSNVSNSRNVTCVTEGGRIRFGIESIL